MINCREDCQNYKAKEPESEFLKAFRECSKEADPRETNPFTTFSPTLTGHKRSRLLYIAALEAAKKGLMQRWGDHSSGWSAAAMADDLEALIADAKNAKSAKSDTSTKG